MREPDNALWVGAINGAHVVYDPGLQVPGSLWVLLYLVNRQAPIPYRRRHARTVAIKHDASHPERARNLERYLAWRGALNSQKLEDLFSDIRRKDRTFELEMEVTRSKHEAFLRPRGEKYVGAVEPQASAFVRNANCMQCHRAVGSDLNLECKACRWIVCPSCGACGCGFTSTSANNDF